MVKPALQVVDPASSVPIVPRDSLLRMKAVLAQVREGAAVDATAAVRAAGAAGAAWEKIGEAPDTTGQVPALALVK